MTVSNLQALADGRFRRTYAVSLIDQQPATANYILLSINAPPGYGVYLRRLIVWNIGWATAAQKTTFELVRTTAVSAGGAVETPQPYDVGNVFAGVVRSGNPTVTPAAQPIDRFTIVTPAALTYINPIALELNEDHRQTLIVPSGVANGMALRVANGAAGYVNFDMTAVFTEEPY